MADIAQITYHENYFYIRLSNEDKTYFDAIRQSLVTWKRYVRKGKPALLRAVPLRLAYNEAKELFGENLVESREMQLWYQDQEAIPTVIGGDSKIERKLESLYEVQKLPTLKLMLQHRAILTAAPGLGKTVMAVTALASAQRNLVLIVAPLTLLDDWQETIQTWWLDQEEFVDFPFMETWYAAENIMPINLEYPWIIITTSDVIEAIEKQGTLEDIFGDHTKDRESVIIIDESYRYKNRNALRSNAVEQAADLFYTKWLLSGMPVAKFVDDLYMQLHILYPGTFTSYWAFVHRYCIVKETKWGTSIAGNRPNALDKMKDDMADILITCDYPDHIPDWNPVIVECPMHPVQDAIYQSLKKQKMVEAEQLGRATKLTLKTIVSLTGRLLQIASNPVLVNGHNISSKWDRLEDLLKDDPLPALVWVQYQETAKLLEARLSGKHWLTVGTITGKTKVAERRRLVKAFQAGELKVLILHPAVAKYGLTLTAARTAYYLELGYDAEAFYQTLFRARRIVSTESVKLVYLLATKSGIPNTTVDHLAHRTLLDRSERAQILTVGDLLGTL